MNARRLVPLVLTAALAGCSPAAAPPEWSSVREVTPAFLANAPAFEPSLAADARGRVALAYVTRGDAGADLWLALSADSGAHFGAPQRLNARAGKVSSYPESRPVLAWVAGGRLVVGWASARDTGQMADDIVVRASGDDGASFGPEVFLNHDRDRPGSAYHGFLVLHATPGGRVSAAWVDGRDADPASGPEPFRASIYAASSDDGGERWSAEQRVTDAACPCCRPGLVASDGGLVALAYRGERDSLRDPRLAISRDGGVTFRTDTLVSADRWKLAGCPSTGPAISFRRGGGWIAWFTGAGAAPGVYAATWRGDADATGSPQPLGDGLAEAQHPQLAAFGPVTLAGVLGRTKDGRRTFALRTLADDGTASPWLLLGANASAPALAVAGANHALAAWVEPAGAASRVRLVRVTRR